MQRAPWAALGVLFVAVTLITAIVRLPLALVLGLADAPLRATEISGTIWNGRIEGAQVAGYALGDIDVSGHVLPLLSGHAGAGLVFSGPLVNGKADVDLGRASMRIENASLTVDLAPLQLFDAFGAPMRGTAEADIPQLVVEDGRCVLGALTVSTDVLRESVARYGGEGFVLDGEGGCEDGALVLPLMGQGPEGRADVVLRLARAGYLTELTFEPRDPRLAEALRQYGFQEQAGRYSLVQRGGIF
jgi:general secretion pathway protein N